MRFLQIPLLVVVALLTACSSTATVRVLAYNIHHGAGIDEVLDLERIARLIEASGADVVALQEVDRGVERTGGVDQARVLAERTAMHVAFGPFMPYQGGEYGMAILSKFPIETVTNHELPPGPEPRTTLAARVRLPDGGDLVIAGIHFYRTEVERLAQARATRDALAGHDGPVILAGDFNSRPGGAVLDFLAGDYRFVEKDEPRDTFPSPAPLREIDHFMLRPAARFVGARARVLDERVASDHRPILLEVGVR